MQVQVNTVPLLVLKPWVIPAAASFHYLHGSFWRSSSHVDLAGLHSSWEQHEVLHFYTKLISDSSFASS